MVNHTQPSTERIDDPNLANVIGYGMQESGFVDLACEASHEGESEATAYLWRKAYEYGAREGMDWLFGQAEHLGESLQVALPVYTPSQQKAILASAKAVGASPLPRREIFSNIGILKTASVLAIERDKPLTRKEIADILGKPVESIQRFTAVLLEHEFIGESGGRPSYLTPNQTLQEEVNTDPELALWKRFFVMGKVLGLRTEWQILNYLVDLGDVNDGSR